MGRDISVVSTHPASVNPVVRSIISADEMGSIQGSTAKFDLKPHKVFLFNKESEERVYFGAQVEAHEKMIAEMKAEGQYYSTHEGPLPREQDDKAKEDKPVEEKKGKFAKLKGLFKKSEKKEAASEAPAEQQEAPAQEKTDSEAKE